MTIVQFTRAAVIGGRTYAVGERKDLNEPEALAQVQASNAVFIVPSVRSVLNSAQFAQAITTRSRALRVMDSAPTVSFSNTNALASGREWSAINSNGLTNVAIGHQYATVRGAAYPVIGGTNFPDYFYTRFTSVDYGSGALQSNVYLLSFLHSGSTFSLALKRTTGILLCRVNGEYVSLTPQSIANDGGRFFYQLTFASRDERLIELIGTNQLIGSIWTEATDSIRPARPVGPTTVFLGDSYVEGTGAAWGAASGWAMRACEYLGITNVYINGRGGSGFVQGTPNYMSRFARDIAPLAPQLLVIQGSGNDSGATNAALIANIEATVAMARAANPNAVIVLTSQPAFGGPERLGALPFARRDLIRQIASARGCLFVDFLEGPAPVSRSVLTLAAAASANATTVSVANHQVPLVGGTYAFADGTQVQIRGWAGLGPYTATLGGPLPLAQLSGAVMTQVGDCPLSGVGRIGSTAGWGNSDLAVLADGDHLSQVGHDLMASGFVNQLMAQTI